MSQVSSQSQTNPSSSVLEKPRDCRPKKYKVLLLNDNYTPMDFVVDILVSIFRKSQTEAESIMLAVHHQGQGLAGVYSKELAESKITKTHELARQNEFPLRCHMEQVTDDSSNNAPEDSP